MPLKVLDLCNVVRMQRNRTTGCIRKQDWFDVLIRKSDYLRFAFITFLSH